MIKRLLAALAAMTVLAIPATAMAFGAQSGENITVPKGETKTGTYFMAGQVLTVDGDIDGDLICAGNSITVNGAVHGDVICAGQTVSINGPVDGSVRLAGQVVNVNGSVGRNGMVAAQSFSLGSAAKIGGDLGLAAQMANVNGPVAKDVYGTAQNLSIGAAVGTVSVAVNSLALGPDAQIQGNLNYTSERASDVDKSKVTGDINHKVAPNNKAERENAAAKASLAWRLYWMAAAMLVGLVLVLVAPKVVGRISRIMRERPGASIGWGLVVTLLTPVLAVLLLVTVIGIPLAVLIGVIWLMLLCLSGVFAGIAAGEWFLQRAEWRGNSLLWAAVLGVPLTVIIFSIPVLGGLVSIVASWWAVGGVALAAKPLRG